MYVSIYIYVHVHRPLSCEPPPRGPHTLSSLPQTSPAADKKKTVTKAFCRVMRQKKGKKN